MKHLVVTFLSGLIVSFGGLTLLSQITNSPTDTSIAEKSTVGNSSSLAGGKWFNCGSAKLDGPKLLCDGDSKPVRIVNIPEKCEGELEVKWSSDPGLKLLKDEKKVPGSWLVLERFKKIQVINEDNLEPSKQVKATLRGGRSDCNCGSAKIEMSERCKMEITNLPSVIPVGKTTKFKVKHKICDYRPEDDCDFQAVSQEGEIDDPLFGPLGPDEATGMEELSITPNITGEGHVSIYTDDCPSCNDRDPIESFCAKPNRSLKPTKDSTSLSSTYFDGIVKYVVSRERCETTGGVNVNERGFEPGDVEKLRNLIKGAGQTLLGMLSGVPISGSSAYRVDVSSGSTTNTECPCSGETAIEQVFFLMVKLKQKTQLAILGFTDVAPDDLIGKTTVSKKGKCCDR